MLARRRLIRRRQLRFDSQPSPRARTAELFNEQQPTLRRSVIGYRLSAITPCRAPQHPVAASRHSLLPPPRLPSSQVCALTLSRSHAPRSHALTLHALTLHALTLHALTLSRSHALTLPRSTLPRSTLPRSHAPTLHAPTLSRSHAPRSPHRSAPFLTIFSAAHPDCRCPATTCKFPLPKWCGSFHAPVTPSRREPCTLLPRCIRLAVVCGPWSSTSAPFCAILHHFLGPAPRLSLPRNHLRILTPRMVQFRHCASPAPSRSTLSCSTLSCSTLHALRIVPHHSSPFSWPRSPIVVAPQPLANSHPKMVQFGHCASPAPSRSHALTLSRSHAPRSPRSTLPTLPTLPRPPSADVRNQFLACARGRVKLAAN